MRNANGDNPRRHEYLDPVMTSKVTQAAPTAPRPSLDALYKPVGINAVTAANICKTGKVKASAPKAK